MSACTRSSVPTNDARSEERAFFQWTGLSGVSYLHLVYRFVRIPPFNRANFVLARRDDPHHCTPLYFGLSVEGDRGIVDHETFAFAKAFGANELHVHAVPGTLLDQMNVQHDLIGKYDTLLNRMSIAGALSTRAA